MTGAAQIVVDFRDGEGPEEGVVCPARVWPRPEGEFSQGTVVGCVLHALQ